MKRHIGSSVDGKGSDYFGHNDISLTYKRFCIFLNVVRYKQCFGKLLREYFVLRNIMYQKQLFEYKRKTNKDIDRLK